MRNWLIAAATSLVASALVVGSGVASALPIAPEPIAPVAGIPQPCASTHPFPEQASTEQVAEQLSENFGFKLAGEQWTKSNREPIKILWQTLDALECTDYLKNLQSKVSGTVGLNAARISGYAWGDWGLTKPGYVSLDFSKFQRALDAGDEGRLTRLVVHELAHTLNSDRFSEPEYWSDFKALMAKEGRFSDYAGSSETETFADVVGYYVGRCALNNPYDTGKYDAYYEYAKEYIFDGREFGPAPGVKADCEAPETDAEAPMPGGAPAWLEGLGGE